MTRYRPALLALSLANLCFFSTWKALLFGVYHPFFVRYPAASANALAMMLDVLLLAALLWTGQWMSRRWWPRQGVSLAGWGLLLTCLLVGHRMLRQLIPPANLSRPLLRAEDVAMLSVGMGLCLVLVVGPEHRFRSAVRLVSSLVVLLSPFVLFTYTQALWIAVHDRRPSKPREKPLPLAQQAGSRAGPRVLWLIFDELDELHTFSQRPSTLMLPELDRLRAESVAAENAFPPAYTTLLSLPSLLLGERLIKAVPSGMDDMLVVPSTTRRAVRWSAWPNVFSKASAAGFSSAAIGWYLPYCRLLAGSVASCFWAPMHLQDEELPFRKRMLRHLLEVVPRRIRTQLLDRYRIGPDTEDSAVHMQHYVHILAQAKKAAADPTLDFVLIHWPVPHDPWIYDRLTGQLGPRTPRGGATWITLRWWMRPGRNCGTQWNRLVSGRKLLSS